MKNMGTANRVNASENRYINLSYQLGNVDVISTPCILNSERLQCIKTTIAIKGNLSKLKLSINDLLFFNSISVLHFIC